MKVFSSGSRRILPSLERARRTAARRCAWSGRYFPVRGSRLRRTSRLIVDGARPSFWRSHAGEFSAWSISAMTIRSSSDRNRAEIAPSSGCSVIVRRRAHVRCGRLPCVRTSSGCRLAVDPDLPARGRVAHPLRHQARVLVTLVHQQCGSTLLSCATRLGHGNHPTGSGVATTFRIQALNLGPLFVLGIMWSILRWVVVAMCRSRVSELPRRTDTGGEVLSRSVKEMLIQNAAVRVTAARSLVEPTS